MSKPDASSSASFSLLAPLAGKWKQFELKAAQIRLFAGLKPDEPLDAFRLAQAVNLRVVTLDEVKGLSEQAQTALRKPNRQWSGITLPPLPDGSRVVVLNPKQSRARQAATLMEEVCHVLLGHDHTNISAESESGRNYQAEIEEEAYAVGAAALVPHTTLVAKLESGQSLKQIAAFFGVSQSLIRYRVKVLKLTHYLV